MSDATLSQRDHIKPDIGISEMIPSPMLSQMLWKFWSMDRLTPVTVISDFMLEEIGALHED